MTTSRKTLTDVLERLAEESRVGPDDPSIGSFAQRIDEALADDRAEEAPWYVHLFVGLGTWIGAVVAASFLAIVGLLDDAGEAGRLGVVLLVVAIVLAHRSEASVLVTQLTWVLAIGAQVALLASAIDLDEDLLLVAVLLQVVSFAAIPLLLFRYAATVAGVVSLAFWLLLREIPLGLDVWVIAVMVGCLVAWLNDSRICAGRGADLWQPLAFGLPTGLMPALALLTVRAQWGWHEDTVSLPLLVNLALGFLGFWILAVGTREQSERPRPELVVLCAVGTAAVVALSHEVPGIIASFMFLALAHLRRDRWLEGIGIIQLGFFLSLFYYSLDTPLLHKSMWIGLTGVAFLVLAGALRRLTRRPTEIRDEEDVAPSVASAANRRRPLLFALLLALAIPTVSVLHKENVLARGQTILLELRPVDPRSLMQGDFMILSYALEQEIFDRERRGGGDLTRSGQLVLGLDAYGVAKLVGENRAAAPGELLLTYRMRGDRWRGRDLRLGAESFFFEEGAAELYASAKYGELRVAPSGTAVLVGLRDAKRQPLGHRLHDVR